MTFDPTKLAAIAAKAVETGKDMTQAQKGGGDYQPPAAGPCGLRFVGYVEIGKHEKSFKGVAKTQDRVQLVFELSGPNHPAGKDKDDKPIPIRLTVEENLSLNEKAGFFKLFNRMNHSGTAKHMVSLIGQDFKGTVVHRKYAKAGEDKSKPETWTGVSAELRNKDGYTIMPPFYDEVIDGMATGKQLRMRVAEAISTPRYFLWDHADMDQWNSLFIDGEFEERKDEKTGKVIAPAKSKNVFQNKIRTAKNFKGSPIYTLLAANGGSLDIPEAEVPGEEEEQEAASGTPATNAVPEGAAADDALAGVV